MTATRARFIIVRDIAAPRERVFRAWLDPEQTRGWLRAAQVSFHEVVAPRRLVLTSGDDCRDPDAAMTAIVFADRGVHTEITLAASAPEEEADELEEAWTLMLDDLEASLTVAC
jgi:uncharacterized protein YndB with AHSA1/START domain